MTPPTNAPPPATIRSVAVFGSSVSLGLGGQLDFLAREGIRFLELGPIDRTPIAQLDSDTVDTLVEACPEAGVEVVAIRTGIGLAAEPAQGELDRVGRCVRIARRLGARFLLLRADWHKLERTPRDGFSRLCTHLQWLLQSACADGITFCIRNVAGTTCETSLDLLRLVEAVGSSRLRAVFDPANAALVGETAYSDGFPLLAPYLAYLHCRDFDPGMGIFVPPGEGVCQWVRILSHIRQSGLDLPLCLDCSVTPVGEDASSASITRAQAGVLALRGLIRRHGAVEVENTQSRR